MCAGPKLFLTQGQLHATLKPFSTGLSEDWVGRSYLIKFFKAISLALLIFTGGPSMAFGGSLVLASALEGRLLDGEGGRPVSGVTIKRNWSWAWTNREGSDETVTDSEGRFRFQEVVGRSPLAQSKPSKALICPAVQWPGALALGCLPPKQGLEWLCRAKENTRATSQLSVGALPSIRTGCQTSMLLCLLVRVAYPCIRGFAVSTTLWSRELKMPCAAATQPRST